MYATWRNAICRPLVCGQRVMTCGMLSGRESQMWYTIGVFGRSIGGAPTVGGGWKAAEAICQNKANLHRGELAPTDFLEKDYEKNRGLCRRENKANSGRSDDGVCRGLTGPGRAVLCRARGGVKGLLNRAW